MHRRSFGQTATLFFPGIKHCVMVRKESVHTRALAVPEITVSTPRHAAISTPFSVHQGWPLQFMKTAFFHTPSFRVDVDEQSQAVAI